MTAIIHSKLRPISLYTFLLISLTTTFVRGQATSSGTVLFNAKHQSIHKDQVASKEIGYYSWPRGPYIENKYTAYRLLLSAESVGSFDPFCKKQYISVIPYFNDPKYNKGAKHDYGSDIYHVGNMAGLGSPMFKVGNDWVMLPFYDKTASIIVELLDTSIASPRYRVSYKDWAINDQQKIDVSIEVYTSWEERHIHVEMKVTGFTGKVGIGLQPADDIASVKDDKAATLYHYGIFQKGKEMLQAIQADPIYFESFDKDDQGEVMVVKSDHSGVIKWSFLHSWSGEPNPLFKEENWQKKLIPTK